MAWLEASLTRARPRRERWPIRRTTILPSRATARRYCGRILRRRSLRSSMRPRRQMHDFQPPRALQHNWLRLRGRGQLQRSLPIWRPLHGMRSGRGSVWRTFCLQRGRMRPPRSSWSVRQPSCGLSSARRAMETKAHARLQRKLSERYACVVVRSDRQLDHHMNNFRCCCKKNPVHRTRITARGMRPKTRRVGRRARRVTGRPAARCGYR